MEFNLNTGRTFNQGATMEIGKGTKVYMKAAALCEMDTVDMEKIGVRDGDTVKVSSPTGEVIVYVAKTTQNLRPGSIFMPMGPWCNSILRSGTETNGMPDFKNVPVTVEKADGEEVLTAFDLMKKVYMKGGN